MGMTLSDELIQLSKEVNEGRLTQAQLQVLRNAIDSIRGLHRLDISLNGVDSALVSYLTLGWYVKSLMDRSECSSPRTDC
jgi:hypothetical protein